METEIKTPLPTRLYISFIYFLMALTGYFIMLLVMTFNVGVLIAIVLGISTGNLITGYLKLPKLDKSLLRSSQDVAVYRPTSDQCCTDVDLDNY